ncbi:uncharacterized protein [Parasteatoda tepidariorum]|uniref:uncharacterized protein n=1 Tax=Parasteatoda tepidariorum TaxID=114398 RepID=UPI001C71FB0E|nr:uncharacterized protein LOC122271108 [Parasteatoda tepidariorum]
MPLTAAEKQRRYRERRKLDKNKEEECKLKARDRYHKTKKLANDMSAREHRLARKKWRTKKAKQRQRIKQNSSPLLTSNAKKELTGSARKKMRRDRTKLYKENINLKIENKKIKQKVEKLRKRVYRAKISNRYEDCNLTPRSKTKQFMRTNFPGINTPEIQNVSTQLFKYNALTHCMSSQYKSLRERNKKKILKNIVTNKVIKKYRLMRKIASEALGLKSKIRKAIQQKNYSIKNKSIQDFYIRDDISRATAGKKETVTKYSKKNQKRYLLDTIKNLHKKFLEEGGKCSYASFAANRPFYVLSPSVDTRNTCLCKLHSNVKFKITALKKIEIIQTNNISDLIEATVCSPDSKDCMYKACPSCFRKKVPLNEINTDAQAEWNEWNYKSEMYEKEGKKLSVKKVSKMFMTSSVSTLTSKFIKEFDLYKKHVFNIQKQYEAYRDCIENLKPNEAAIHVDFSENYNLKLSEEIQAHHYGASQNSITLHTGLTYCGIEKNKPVSFSTVSSSYKHNPSAIWAHLTPILKMIKETDPKIDTLHFFSDGPSTQYRQKNNFYLFSQRLFKYDFMRGTWSFFESGHGKGAADGIGGTLKRIADRIVACGTDITDVHQFIHCVRKSTEIKLFCVTEEEIEAISKTLPEKIPMLKGTRSLHQLIVEKKGGYLRYRDISCFCGVLSQRGFCHCYGTKDFITTAYPEIKQDQKTFSSVTQKHFPYNNKKLNVFDIYSSSSNDSILTDEDNLYSLKESNLKHQTREPNCKNITAGTYLLIQILGGKKNKSKYKYVGIAQGDVEDDGDIKVMFLKTIDDSGKNFQVKENGASYIQFDSVLGILKNPNLKMKGNRIFYQFDDPVDVYEK